MKKLLFLPVLLFLPCIIYSQPCSNYACDSLVVRKILDLNGLDTLTVARVADSNHGRITRLDLEYGYLLRSLPIKLIRIPPEIGELTDLESLNINGNDLAIIPGEIRNLKKLKILWMSNNPLDSLPAFMWQLTNLQELNLVHTRIIRLSDSIALLKKMKYLSLDGNLLEKLPDSIFRLKNLTVLSIAENRIGSLPDSIVRLDSMKCIFIGDNALCSLSPEIVNWIGTIREKKFCERGEAPWPETQKCSNSRDSFYGSENRFDRSVRLLSEKNGIVAFRVEFSHTDEFAIDIFDNSGRRLGMPVTSRVVAGAGSINLNVKKYGPGTYVLRFRSGTKVLATKLLNVLR